MSYSKATLSWIFSRADVRINGDRPWDIKVKDERFFSTVLRYGSLGLGESYMRGWWECEQLENCIARILKARLDRWGFINPTGIGRWLKDKFTNPAPPELAFLIGERHYDVGNDLYQAMLGPTMAYTCAYWTDAAKGLDQAQTAKFDLVCRKLGLTQGQRILDIGCGFGSFAKFAAEHYGVTVVGTTVSVEQAKFGREFCKGLPVKIRVEDYRETAKRGEKFDHVVSLGMFEHVEPRNYETYFQAVSHCLEGGGFFLLHTIGKMRGGSGSDPWIRKYIFPLGLIPTKTRIRKGSANYFSKELDWHDLGSHHYRSTLLAWHDNFAKAWNDPGGGLKVKYGEEFGRMWKYYLLSCSGAFQAKNLDVWQVVLARENRNYTPVR